MKNKFMKATASLIVVFLIFLWYESRDDGKIPVGVNGVSHMGTRYSISQYYVDDFYGSNIGREGGGGSHTCCVILPREWRPGMIVDLRWEVYDYERKSLTRYRARVPVEKYKEVGDVVVHIFRDNSARFVTSIWDVMSANHPVAWGESDGGSRASKGTQIATLFTEQEIKAFEQRQGPRGSWR